MKICYIPRNFKAETLDIIERAETICQDYADEGYGLTLRQLYYRFVANNWIENKDTEYDRLGSIVNDARLAGLIDWDHLEDRTRNLERNSHWGSPEEVMQTVAKQYLEDRWADQSYRIEAWVEKEALVGVVGQACRRLDVPFFACRGYVSQSEMHAAADRFKDHEANGQYTTILYLGDHDPSGMNMSVDIQKRLRIFGAGTKVERIALNMDQIQKYNPPPNPAKLTDSRSKAYIEEFGRHSWELDSLEPRLLEQLVTQHVKNLRDENPWKKSTQVQEKNRRDLTRAYQRWEDVVEFLA